MTDSERLKIIRKHLGEAQAALVDFIDPQSDPEGPAAMKRLVDHLVHRDLVRALSESDGEKNIQQADAKSNVKAKHEQAA